MKCVKGDLLDSNCKFICQQVNCQGRMGSGIAKQIREKWPVVYTSYARRCEHISPEVLLGQIDIVSIGDRRYVINIFGQLNYGYDGKLYTSYEAFQLALNYIKGFAPEGCTIGFPKNIGCGLGGGDWNIISRMIEDTLGEKYDVYIYEL